MGVLAEDTAEEGGAGGEDQLVGLDVLVAGADGQGDIEEVFLLPKLPEGHRYVRLKIVPAKAELLRGRHCGARW